MVAGDGKIVADLTAVDGLEQATSLGDQKPTDLGQTKS